jgi:hypothetical protein
MLKNNINNVEIATSDKGFYQKEWKLAARRTDFLRTCYGLNCYTKNKSE